MPLQLHNGMKMAEWMDRDCKVWPALQPAGKVRSFTPRGSAARVVFNPLALHFARRPPPPLPVPACLPPHLPGVGFAAACCAWSEKSCPLRLHFHINCPPACLVPGGEGGWGPQRRGEAARGELNQNFFDSRLSRNQNVHFLPRVDAIIALLPWKDMHRFTSPCR